MLTNIGLVEHSKKALAEKWGYVWGTFGQVLTPELLKEKMTQYPYQVGEHVDLIKGKWLHRRTADCIGLIKSYLWWTPNGPIYTPATDVSADGMFELASEKGTINSFPVKDDMIGLCLWKKGHIGVYIGDGQVIEANSTSRGVIQTPLQGVGATSWTHWIKCPYVSYIKPTKDWTQLVNEVSNGSAHLWIEGINAAVAAAKADGNLGALEIFQHLPLLIEKLGNK